MRRTLPLRSAALRQTGRIVGLSAIAAACAHRPDASPVDGAAIAVQEVRAAMRAYDSILVYGPPDSTATKYTADGILFIPGMEPLRGRRAILDFLAPVWIGSTVLIAKTTVDTVELLGDRAYLWGSYEEIAGPKGQAPSLYRGRVVIDWVREADGRWRIARVMTQPTPPAPAASH